MLGNNADRIAWYLLPVVETQLRTYAGWQENATTVPDTRADDVSVCAFPFPFRDRLSFEVRHRQAFRELSAALRDITGLRVSDGSAGPTAANKSIPAFNDLSALSGGFMA